MNIRAPPPTQEIEKLVIAACWPWWSMPPPWKVLADIAYGASTSSTKPRALRLCESDFRTPVKLGTRKRQGEPVEACGFWWLDQLPGGKLVEIV